MSGIIAFFRASPPKAGAAFDEHRFRRVRWQTFIAMTTAYVTFTSAGYPSPSPKARWWSWGSPRRSSA